MADTTSDAKQVLTDQIYSEYPYSVFPQHVDDSVFKTDEDGAATTETYAPPKMSDIDADVSSKLNDYNVAFASGNFDQCAQYLTEEVEGAKGVKKRLIDCMFTADKFNWLRDAMLSMEKFLLESVTDYINRIVDDNLHIQIKKYDSNRPESNAVTYSAKYINSLFNEYFATLKADNWQGSAEDGYTQDVEARATDGTLIPDEDYVCYPSIDQSPSVTVKNYNKAYAYIYGGATNKDGNHPGIVTMYAFKKPKIDFTIKFARN